MFRILIVDDEQVMLDGCEATLTRTGYDVDTALSTEEALEKTERGRYDIIVTDLKLPGLSGMEFLKILNLKFLLLHLLIYYYNRVQTYQFLESGSL